MFWGKNEKNKYNKKKIKIKHNKEKKRQKKKQKIGGKYCSGKSTVAINNAMCGELQYFPHTIYNPYCFFLNRSRN